MNDDQLKRRFKQLDERIDALDQKPVALPAKRRRFTLDRWLILAALIVAVLAWWQPQWATSSQRAADDHIDVRIGATVGRDVQTIKESVADLTATVRSIRNDLDLLLQKQLKVSGRLPEPLFQQNIDVIATQVSLAQQRRVSLDPQTLKELQRKISSGPSDKSATWIAASAVLNYTSPPPPAYPKSLPECIVASMGTTFKRVTLKLHDCVLVLDGKTLADVRIENTVVKYSGGPVQMKNVQFVNCYFDFTITKTPPPEGQLFVRRWLTAGGKSLAVG